MSLLDETKARVPRRRGGWGMSLLDEAPASAERPRASGGGPRAWVAARRRVSAPAEKASVERPRDPGAPDFRFRTRAILGRWTQPFPHQAGSALPRQRSERRPAPPGQRPGELPTTVFPPWGDRRRAHDRPRATAAGASRCVAGEEARPRYSRSREWREERSRYCRTGPHWEERRPESARRPL